MFLIESKASEAGRDDLHRVCAIALVDNKHKQHHSDCTTPERIRNRWIRNRNTRFTEGGDDDDGNEDWTCLAALECMR
jgi:hypothetical protein